MRSHINLINELFNSELSRVKWEMHQGDVLTSFVVDGFRYDVDFSPSEDDGWSCSFAIDFGYRKGTKVDSMDPVGILGTGNAYQVFSKVLYIISKFIEKYSPTYIEFYADEDSRRKLYATMVRMLAKRLPSGYTAHSTSGYGGNYEIVRDDYWPQRLGKEKPTT